MLEEVVVIVWVEERLDCIWNLEYSIGNVLCGIHRSSSLFEWKNGLIPFELWSVAMETYIAESAKNCE